MSTLLVSEIFGPTFQGEGRSLGSPVGFVRLGICNLHCTWCDTPYTWDHQRFDLKAELRRVSIDTVLAQIDEMGVDRVVVSGGEPLLQQEALTELMAPLVNRGLAVEIETNGTIVPTATLVELTELFTVSPKLANAGDPGRARIRPDALEAFVQSARAVFKFVVVEPTDLDEIDALVRRFGLRPVYVMPEGCTAEVQLARLRSLADPALERGYALTPRLHILIWGDTRGK